MDELKMQQVEILKELVPFSERVLAAIDDVIEELGGIKKPETDDNVKEIIEAINWILEVYNGTKDLINPDENELDQNLAESGVKNLQRAMRFSNDRGIADALYQLGMFIKAMHTAAEKVIAE